MLAEVLTFSLLAGVAVLSHVYGVLTHKTEYNKKLVETTVFGTAPATVGIAIGVYPSESPGVGSAPNVAFTVFSCLFVACLLLRYAFPTALTGTRSFLIDFGTTAFLVGIAVSVAVASPSDALVPFSLIYIGIFYFWVNDGGGNDGTSRPKKTSARSTEDGLPLLQTTQQRPPAQTAGGMSVSVASSG